MTPAASSFQLDPVALVLASSWPVRATAALLVVASTAVWAIAWLKAVQLGRLARAEGAFERAAGLAADAGELCELAQAHPGAPGARVVLALASRPLGSDVERLRAAAERALVVERHRAESLATVLGSVAATAPFVGLFGTVYGILDAFVRIGAEKSASLPVVAPAIGEALVTTAIGLLAAIPAVVFYNAIERRAGKLCEQLDAAAGEWVAMLASPAASAPSARPGPR